MRCSNRVDSNLEPLSVVMTEGTQKRATQLDTKASVTVSAVILGMGRASDQRVNLSITVNRL